MTIFKQDTLNKIETLNENDIVHILEAAYASYSDRYWKAVDVARRLQNQDDLISDFCPSLRAHIAPLHQHREDQLNTTLDNATHYKNLADILNYVLRDLNEARIQNSMKDIIDYIKNH
jgi:hypothetical protein